jgi:hypothetical protein
MSSLGSPIGSRTQAGISNGKWKIRFKQADRTAPTMSVDQTGKGYRRVKSARAFFGGQAEGVHFGCDAALSA